MMTMLRSIKSVLPFLLVSALFLLIGVILLMTEEKISIHLVINGLHNGFFDFFFNYFTHAGDGLFTAISAVLIFVYLYSKFGWSTFILGFFTLIFVGLLAQFMKQVIYPDALRPLLFIGEEKLRLVPNVEMYLQNSFPSGHTATAFAFFLFFAYSCFKSNWPWQIICALFAVGVGYSRMYLSQHFLEDVVMGAGLGIFAFFLAFLLTRVLPLKNNIARIN